MNFRTTLDEATNKWGVKVNRVEIQDIFPPADIQASMDKLMKADREKKATITEAEGLKEAAIRKAEGEKRPQSVQQKAPNNQKSLEPKV